MDTISAFFRGRAAKGQPQKVFDWDKAAEILKSRNIKNASAGLQDDLEYTCGEILIDGKIHTEDYTYLSSNWAIPVLLLDTGEEIECYKMESETDWDNNTKWPESAIKIFNG